MTLIDAVAMLALLQYLFFTVLVGRARVRGHVQAPAVSGDEGFERAYRVQMNTLELLIALLPALYVAARYWPAAYVAGAGVVFLVGRLIYWRAYLSDPNRRSLGFALSILPVLVLVLASLGGALAALRPN
ncbi:MAG TPA: MAPEG family protein [Rubrivivax sp.]|nr:MAPEG family protein [Burkholderiales bacterium]HNT39882.1 MAPEG family protein [Rubrivivax sp.]